VSDWRRDRADLWFGLDPKQWWKADPRSTRNSRTLSSTVGEKRQLPVSSFLDDPLTALAGVILFDQFPRNMFRGHAEQFATDHLALAIATEAVRPRAR
jgi:uncharacterized protein (DUF924 family)